MPTPLPRSKVKKNQTWNAESVFASPDVFDVAVNDILDTLPEIKKYQGHLGDNVDTFLEAVKAMEALEQRSMKVRVYATLSSAVDATDESGAAMNGKAMSALAQVGAATSFVEPELLSVGEAKLRKWIKDDKRMKLYEHFVNDLFRKQEHVRSAEVEELMGMLRDPFGAIRSTAGMLANADFKFKPAQRQQRQKAGADPKHEELAHALTRPQGAQIRLAELQRQVSRIQEHTGGQSGRIHQAERVQHESAQVQLGA
jgi:oligoendopeptidase F